MELREIVEVGLIPFVILAYLLLMFLSLSPERSNWDNWTAVLLGAGMSAFVWLCIFYRIPTMDGLTNPWSVLAASFVWLLPGSIMGVILWQGRETKDDEKISRTTLRLIVANRHDRRTP